MAFNLQTSLSVKGSDTIIWDFSCDACNTNEAKFYCEGCSKCYCGNCVKLHNQLFNSHSLFGRERMEKWPISKSTSDILEQCDEHSDEKIKLFCEDHSRLCCHSCVALHHRTCRITYLFDGPDKYSTADVPQLSLNIQKALEEMKKLTDVADCNLQSMKKTKVRIKEHVNNTRQKINAALDLLEKATIHEIDKIIANCKIAIIQERDEFSNLQKSLQRHDEALNEVCNKGSKLLVIAFEKSQQQIKNSKMFLNELKYINKYDMDFAPNIDIEQFLSKLTNLGRIKQPHRAFSLKKMSEYIVLGSYSKISCGIHAFCELPSGESLVLAAIQRSGTKHSIYEVKLLDKKHSCLSNCEVSRNTLDMCLISPSEVIVATEGRGQRHSLQIITVKNDKLEKGRKLELLHESVGIAKNEDDLYVTSGNALYHYTLTGTLTQNKKLYEDTQGRSTVHLCAVNRRGDKIYVTNKHKNTLLTLATDGTLISTFSDYDLQGPRGIHVTPGGPLLVCGEKSNTIIQVDSEGKKKLAILATEKDGMKQPCSVFYSSITDSVIVGFANNDSIMVFKVT